MAGVASPLRPDQSRGAGDAHPAPRATWEEKGWEGVMGGCAGARKRPRRD